MGGLSLQPPTSERGLNTRYLSLVALQEIAILLPLSVLVLHMTDRGLNLGSVGLAFAIRSLIVVLLEVPTGGLADAIGRKPVALMSQAFTMASMLVLLFVTNVPLLLIYAVLQGTGSALHSGSLGAWYVDNLKRINPETNLQQNLARIELIQAVAMISTVLGGVLPAVAVNWQLPWPLSNFGISIFVGLILRAAVWLMTVIVVSEPEFKGQASVAGLKAVPVILKDATQLIRSLPVVPYLLISMIAGGVAMISLETFWQPLTALLYGATPENGTIFGMFGMITGIGLTLGSIIVMRFGHLFPGGSPALAGTSQLIKGVAVLLLALSGNGVALGISLFLAYAMIAANNIPHDTLLHEAVPDERRSVMLSINSLALYLGITIGSSLLGVIASWSGPRVALGVAAVITMVSSLSYVGLAVVQRKQSEG